MLVVHMCSSLQSIDPTSILQALASSYSSKSLDQHVFGLRCVRKLLNALEEDCSANVYGCLLCSYIDISLIVTSWRRKGEGGGGLNTHITPKY